MRLNLIKILVGFGMLFLLVSCEKQIPWTYPETPSRLVVSGIITDELKPFIVTLSYSVNNPNDLVQFVSGAQVYIISDLDTIFLPESIVKGVYTSLTIQRAVINKEYTLHVINNNKEYTATDKMVPITQAGGISYYQSSSDSNLFSLNFDDISSKSQMFYYECNWDTLHTCDSCHVDVYSYSFNSLDVSQIFAPNKRNRYFPARTKITRVQYSLSDNYAEYLRSMQLETSWNGSYFDENSGPVKGNISGNGLGYFAVCAVLLDSTIVLP